MMHTTWTRRVGVIVCALASSMALVACSTSDDTSTTDTVVPVMMDPSRAPSVLLAALILATGDIEDALLQGLVTPADVEDATDAIEAGTLDQWRALAESANSD